jgi:hypothetical protein
MSNGKQPSALLGFLGMALLIIFVGAPCIASTFRKDKPVPIPTPAPSMSSEYPVQKGIQP